MKIVFYSNQFVMGGMENAVFSLLRLLSQTGDYEFIVAFDDDDSATLKMMSKYAEVAKLEHLQQQVIHCDVLVDCSPYSFKVENIHAKRIIYWVHTCRLGDVKQMAYGSPIIAQSKWHKEQVEKLGIKPIIITNPLDAKYILEQSKKSFTDLRIPRNATVYIVVARISPEKGWKRVIDFMKRKENLLNFIVIIGGIYGDRGNLIKMQVLQSIGNRAIFLGEMSNPYPIMKECDYLCSFSDTETYGITTEEAHILGIPVIFNNYPTAQDQFISGFDQWFDGFIPKKARINYSYDNSKNIASIEKWEALLHTKPIEHDGKLDFYASEVQYFDHMIPIWEKLPDKVKGTFYITNDVFAKRQFNGEIGEPADRLCLVASWKDYCATKGNVIFMEHGIGHTYSNDHPSYAGGKGKDRVVLFLNQHEITQKKNDIAYPAVRGEIIGTPKLDNVKRRPVSDQRVVCLSFHWDCYVCPETRSAYNYFKRVIPYLAESKDFKLIMHGHPHNFGTWQENFKGYKVDFYEDFNDILEIADVYVNDNSSTMYEFLTTGRPVVVLNDTGYRKHIHHGIRFWDYIPGIQVDRWSELQKVINHTLDNPNEGKENRNNIVSTLYPYLGVSSQRAADAITEFIERSF